MSELRFTVIPVGEGADKSRLKILFEPGLMFTTLGTNATVATTFTVVLTGLYPVPVAVMVADPKSTPNTLVVTVGAVAPC